MNFLHLRTDYEHVADALAHLSDWAAVDALTLSHDAFVIPGEPVSFRVALEDDTSVLEGTGRCRSCDDLGELAPALARFEVVLDDLDFDARGDAMWRRVLAGTRSSGRTHSHAVPAYPLSRGVSSIPPPLGAPLTHGGTRVVRSDDLLRSSSNTAIDTAEMPSEPSQGPTRMVGVARALHERAEVLAAHPGESRTAAEILRLALRLGLAVLEEQSSTRD